MAKLCVCFAYRQGRFSGRGISTDATIAYILKVIKDSKENGEKSICFVTGVPGAGKTLVGLDVAVKQSYQGGDEMVEDEGAVYLSGNGPLVAVLTEALAIDNHKKCRACGEKKNMSDSRREVGIFPVQRRFRLADAAGTRGGGLAGQGASSKR